ncbi:hypothetical protein HNV11_17950 [Spirosoma taeanense]|uniref:Uncharacterized protein n=1 Tax=Spirosoma taeanense TaxID=2735870 RepID=A0A6M5YCW7_9BACT|nr:hypothetical protein [Spirosoma taeanense]QJW91123.1 hypothetical protein HNV11_17950 [Spirosoma taeanense]
MQRRYFPSILLYGFGLALALSLLFNGFLLYKQSRQPSIYEFELSSAGHPSYSNNGLWQQQLSDCTRATHRKDSRVGSPTTSPIRTGAQRPSQ